MCYSARTPPLQSFCKPQKTIGDQIMSEKKYTLHVYNITSGSTEEVEVSEAVYNEYRRGGWRIENHDRRFRENETPFSDLKGGLDGAYENFEEFRSEADNPEQLAIDALTQQDLRRVLACLTEDERELLQSVAEGKSERQIAKEIGLPQRTLHDRKVNLLRKIKKIMGFEK
jgi:RNA polymerase sigma factor (sigma-70 family)